MVQSALRRSCVHFGTVLLVSSVVVGSAAWAQSPPGGGTILRQIDPPSPPPATPTPQIKVPIETRPALPNSMDMTVDVREVRITGSAAFSQNQLMPLVADEIYNPPRQNPHQDCSPGLSSREAACTGAAKHGAVERRTGVGG